MSRGRVPPLSVPGACDSSERRVVIEMPVARPSLVAVLLALVVFGSTSVVLADGRVALVVGNSTYAHIGRLPNPENDAADVSAALGRLGFEVTTTLDAGLTEFTQLWIRLGRRGSRTRRGPYRVLGLQRRRGLWLGVAGVTGIRAGRRPSGGVRQRVGRSPAGSPPRPPARPDAATTDHRPSAGAPGSTRGPDSAARGEARACPGDADTVVGPPARHRGRGTGRAPLPPPASAPAPPSTAPPGAVPPASVHLVGPS